MHTHYIHISLEDLRNNIDVYTSRNMKWVKKVGSDFFHDLVVTFDVYITDIVSEIRKFNAMAILLACVLHNIHAMILLQKSYWTTRCGNDYS